jgi:DNA polymerase-3 subunit gamma/tau
MDVLEIDGASNTSVNDVREIKDEVLFAPGNSRYKVYIIDEVHMLSNSAFNALLKTIEEPPPYIAFIFATTEIHKVPATIRSRCQQFNFRLIPPEDIKRQLEEMTKEIQVEAEEDALFWIAKEATGSLRDAYTLFDQILSFSQKEITLKEITEKLGLVGFEKLNTLVGLLADGKTSDVLTLTDEVISSGVSIEQFILNLAEYFRNLLFIKNDIRKESLLGTSADRFPEANIRAFSIPQLEEGLQRLLRLFRDIRFSLNQRFELELALSRLSGLKDFIDQKEIVEKIKELRTELVDSSSKEPSDKTVDVERYEESAESCTDQAALSKEELNDLQNHLVKTFKKKMTLSANLQKIKQLSVEGENLHLLFENAFTANSVGEHATEIKKKIEEYTGRKYNIIIDVEKQQQEPQEQEYDEQVEMIKRVFRGEVVQEE